MPTELINYLAESKSPRDIMVNLYYMRNTKCKQLFRKRDVKCSTLISVTCQRVEHDQHDVVFNDMLQPGTCMDIVFVHKFVNEECRLKTISCVALIELDNVIVRNHINLKSVELFTTGNL